MPRTAEEFKVQAQKLRVTEWPFRTCSICDVRISYHFHDNGTVSFYPGCGCSDRGQYEPRTWQDVADHYNMQTSPGVIAEMDSFWKWGAPALTTNETTARGDLLAAMTVERKLQLFQQWQAAGYVHPLTCSGGGGSCPHGVALVPEIKQGLTVVGLCPRCHRVQEENKIPLCVWFIDTLKWIHEEKP